MNGDRDEELFLAARNLSRAEREEFLQAECATPEQRAQVEAMLRDAEGADQFFDDEATTVADLEGKSPAVGAEAPGEVIGRYKLLQQIGEGGFGVVWMAEQLEPVVRRVALKIIKAGMDTREVIARFEAERQALAMMDHPNIAKVFDAGATETGRPFFVMELVKGIPITAFCDERQFDTRKRLELFVEVCSALNHAHQKGVIHRDLKPSNILVTLHGDRPVPKVIDFGIAKATQQKLTEKTLFTRFEQFVGTPVYMSPEQAVLSGLDIDTRSDIYSLGVLLYELLAGRPPFDSKSLLAAGYDEMRRIIREEEPPRPSIRYATLTGDEKTTIARTHQSEAEGLGRQLRGELDWIVMKAIDKDRTRRYETASAFAADIRRFLANEPVHAAAPSAVYRLRKFVRRHRVAAGASAAVAVALVAGTVMSTWQAVRARQANRGLAAQVTETLRQSERAEANFQLAREAVDRFLVRLADDPHAATRMQGVHRRLLEDALGFYERFLESGQGGARLEADALHAMHRIARIHDLIGSKTEAIAAYERAIARWEQAEEPDAATAPGRAKRREHAACWSELAEVQLDLDRYDDALQSIEGALAILRSLREATEEEGTRFDLAVALKLKGIVLTKAYRTEESIAPLEEATAMFESLVGQFPENAEYRSQFGAHLNSLATVELMRGQSERAEALLRSAAGEQRRALEREPSNSRYLEFLANHLLNLGVSLSQRGDPAAAEALDESRGYRERLVRLDPSVTAWQFALARTYVELGVLASEGGGHDGSDSLRCFEQAGAILDQQLAENADWNDARQLLARCRHEHAKLLYAGGRPAEALALWQQAAEASERLVREDPVNRTNHRENEARSLFYVGYLLAELDRDDEAIAALEASRELYAQLAAVGTLDAGKRETQAHCYNSLGLLYAASGRRDEAAESYEAALSILDGLRRIEAAEASHAILAGGVWCNFGHLQSANHDGEAAGASYERAEEVLREALRLSPGDETAASYLFNTLTGRIEVRADGGDFEGAVEVCEEAVRSAPPGYEASLRLRLAYFSAKTGDHERAAAELEALAGEVQFDAAARLNVAQSWALCAAAVRESDRERYETYVAEAVAAIGECLGAGIVKAEEIEAEGDFAVIRDEPGFRGVVAGNRER